MIHLRRPPKTKQSSLVRSLDRAFSEYVRLTHADENGIVRCYTCGWIGHWKECDAGHYITRDNLSTRWEERNVKPQCKQCNRFKSGVSDEFALHLVKDYGVSVLFSLNQLKHMPSIPKNEVGMKAFLAGLKDKVNELKCKIS